MTSAATGGTGPTEPAADTAAADPVDEGDAPRLGGDDVRLGPELTDEPQAGATEPTD